MELTTIRRKSCLNVVDTFRTVVYTPQLNEDVTSITHTFTSASVEFTYGFDYVHEPTGVEVSDSSYMYHPADGSTTYDTSDSVNKYPTVGGNTYSYDDNMNLTGDSIWTYGYDTENQMLTATRTGTSASFVCDPVNRQSQKTVGTTKSRYIYSVWQRIADYDGSTDDLQNRYVYGADLDEPLIQVTSGGVLTFLHADKMGSIIATSDDTGAMTNQNLFGQFGEISTLSGTTFGFTGQRFDPELGLYYFKNRYYSPTIGRFLQPDPIGYPFKGVPDCDCPCSEASPCKPFELNLYTYVANSPLKYTDPMGLDQKYQEWLKAIMANPTVDKSNMFTNCGGGGACRTEGQHSLTYPGAGSSGSTTGSSLGGAIGGTGGSSGSSPGSTTGSSLGGAIGGTGGSSGN